MARSWDEGVSWRSVLVEPPEEEPIHLEYVRESVLRVVNGSVDDEFIGNQIKAVRELWEDETGRAGMEQTWQWIGNRFPCWEIELPRPPLISVTSIEYIDTTGTRQTLEGSPSEFVVLPSGKFTRGRVTPLYGASWPATRYQADAVTVTYQAGYADVADVPEMVKAGMGLMVAELYRYRGAPPKPLDTSRFWKKAY